MNLMLRVLMFCFLLEFTGGSAVIDSHETIKAEISRDAVLPCRLQSPLDMNNLLVEWKHKGTNVHRYRSLSDDPGRDKNYKNRTSLFKSEMAEGNVSLNLTNVTERDAGNYTCDVRIEVLIRKCIVTLKVVAKQEVIQDPSPTPKPEPVNQDLSIETIIVIIVVVVIVVLLAIGIAFGVQKKRQKTNTEQEPKNNHRKRNRRGRNKQKNKKKDNGETVSLQNVGNSSDTSS